MQAPMTSAMDSQSTWMRGRDCPHTEYADDDPANGHDTRPACVETIGEETW